MPRMPKSLQSAAFFAPLCGAVLLSPPWLLSLLQILLWALAILILLCLLLYGQQFKKDVAKQLVKDWLDGDSDAITGPSLAERMWNRGLVMALALCLAFKGMPWLAAAWVLGSVMTIALRRQALDEVRRMDLGVRGSFQAYRDDTEHPV